MKSIRIGKTKVLNISKLLCRPAEVTRMRSTLFEFTGIWQNDQERSPNRTRTVNSSPIRSRFLTVRLGHKWTVVVADNLQWCFCPSLYKPTDSVAAPDNHSSSYRVDRVVAPDNHPSSYRVDSVVAPDNHSSSYRYTVWWYQTIIHPLTG